MAAADPRLWPGYTPRRPQDTVLYQTVERHLEAFLRLSETGGGLPRFVVRELEDYLRCGRLEHGFARCVCRRCGREHRVALSCKRRGFCPSCLGRRMNDLAIQLVDRVLPAVPMRHWVCTLPWSLRAAVGYDRRACTAFVRAFTGGLSRLLRRRAKTQLGLRSVQQAQPGAVTFIQRFDSALRLSPHLHVIALDGVYVGDDDDDEPCFEPLGAPSPDELAWLVEVTAQHLLDCFERAELDQSQPVGSDQPWLAHCYGSAAHGVDAAGPRRGRATVRLLDTGAIGERTGGPLVAEHEGFRSR